MNIHYHAVVWIDHHEARVFHFSPTDVETLVLHPHSPTRHIHHKANSMGSGHAAEDHTFLQAVAESIAGAGAVLITETKQMAREAGLGNISLTPKSEYITAMTDWNDPLYKRIIEHLPAGSGLADYITSLELTAIKGKPNRRTLNRRTVEP